MKRLLKPSKLQWYAFLATMPLSAAIINYILFERAIYHEFIYWTFSFPLIFLLGYLAWYFHLSVGDWLKRKYQEPGQFRTRLIIEIILIFALTSFCTYILIWIFAYFRILGYSWDPADFQQGLLVCCSFTLLIHTLYEADYTFLRYRESAEERQRFLQMSQYQEFDSMKNLVNPHFLFNCLNTLSSLISEDRDKAGKFLEELSKVYRYLLRNNRETLSSIQDELRFIRSYYELLKTRHENALELNIDIDDRHLNYMIPSLSLQLLVENAVKHNIILTDRPLIIDIFVTDGDRLIVNNNLQRKIVNVKSNRVGLENIRSKYRLLNQEGFQVIEDERNYTVVLPLIWHNNIHQFINALP
ncbi:MAG: histidine kinase [Saprospiraceae bacterium]|nr:histidine kinase [Saprospiraceae bacterium]